MKNRVKFWGIAAACALLALFFGCLALGGGVYSGVYDSGVASANTVNDNFSFEKVDVEIEVGKDKVYKVKETLTTRFEQSHVNRGIIRDIQHQTTTTRYINGKKVKGKSFIATLDNVKASFDDASIRPDIQVSRDAYSIAMRNPAGYIESGTHVFVLEYTYAMHDDKMSGYDDFIFDVLGYEMNKTETLNAKITFPEEIDVGKVSVRTNSAGSSAVHTWNPNEEGSGESFSVSGKVITMTAHPYDADKGYTLQVILPDGYFSEARVTFYWYYIPCILAAVVGAAVCIALFLRYTLQGKTLRVVEFYPPEELSVMEFSSIWHRGARAKDTAALILKWADMGLLTIERDGDKHLILRPTGKIDLGGKPNKEEESEDIFSDFYDSDKDAADEPTGEELTYTADDKKYFDNPREKKFFYRLFSGVGGENKFSTRIFNSSSRSNKALVYDDVEELVKKAGDDKFLKGKAQSVRSALPFLGLIPTLVLEIYYCLLCSEFLPIFFFIFQAAGTFVGVMWHKTPQVVIMLIFPVVFYGLTYGISMGMFSLTAYDYCYLVYIAPIWWAVCMFVLPFFVKGRRVPEAQEMYGRLKGFEDFLLKAELPKIQLMFDENPEYFSEILAWCSIMGISGKVAKRFAALNFEPPAFMRDGMDVRWVCVCMYHSGCRLGTKSFGGGSSGGGGFSFGGGGGGHGGSFGGGGGGGGSRGC